MRMAAKLLAHVAVETDVMEEIIALEYTVMLDDPVHLLVDERLQDRRGDVRMIVAAERIANVVEQRSDDVILRFASPVRARRSLKRMLEPVDREPPLIAVEQLQMFQNAIRQS